MSEDFPPGRKFYVMRHAQTTDNLEGRTSGKLSEPLITEGGIEQAKYAGSILKKLENPIDIVVTSSKIRTKETGRIACDNDVMSNLPHIIDDGISERDYGKADGLPEKIRREIKLVGGFIDGEESKESIRNRALKTVRNQLEKNSTPLFVTHGGVVLRLIGAALGGEKVVDRLKEQGRLAKNGDVYEFVTPSKKDEKWQVNLLSLGENKEILRKKVEVVKRISKSSGNNNRNGITI